MTYIKKKLINFTCDELNVFVKQREGMGEK